MGSAKVDCHEVRKQPKKKKKKKKKKDEENNLSKKIDRNR